MSKASSRQRRDTRYRAAVQRQIAMVDAWNAAGPLERTTMWMPAPVEDFLRRGDTADMFRPAEVDHSTCDFAYKPVKCDRCGAEYVCTPSSDFYCAAEGDHCCEPCLLRGAGVPVLTVLIPGGGQA